MAGIKWQIRRTETYDIEDGLWLGEMIFHREDYRLGIMDDVFLAWWPLLSEDGTQMILDTGWLLAAKHGAGNPVVQMEFSVFGEIIFRPMHPNHPWIEGGDAARLPPFLTIGADEQTFDIAPDETLNNGAPNQIEFFDNDPSYRPVQSIDASSTSIDSPLGNGMLWLKSVDTALKLQFHDMGQLDSSLAIKNNDSQANTWNSKGKNVFAFSINKLDVNPNVARGFGYRSWIFDTDYLNDRLTFFMVVSNYGSQGFSFSTRIGYPGNWQQLDSVDQPAAQNSGMKAYAFKFDPKKVKAANIGKPLAIDWMFNCYFDPTLLTYDSDIKIAVGSLAAFPGWHNVGQINPAWLNPSRQRYMSKLYAQTGIGTSFTSIQTVTFETPLITDQYRLAFTTTKTPTILEKTRSGFVVQISDLNDDVSWSYSYRAQAAGDVSDIV